VLPSVRAWPLFDAAASRRIEQAALAATAPHALMARAGLGLARLALALAPQARRIWVAAGPGNNGGDGLVAARHLHLQGLVVAVNLLGDVNRLPADAADALARAQAAGVPITIGLDDAGGPAPDLAIDALLGLGSRRAPEGAIVDAVRRLNAGRAPVLAVDLPTGLCGDSGRRLGDEAVQAQHTLSLLTLKPGLFTALGRDHAGRIWFDGLGVDSRAEPATGTLAGPDTLRALLPGRSHAQHKGSFGDLLVLGGAPGMGGAALLAARAALAAGAGRVYLARLDGDAAPDPQRPELMPRSLQAALAPALLGQATVVCGCGGGEAVRAILPAVLAGAARLVLDADALNAVAIEPALSAALRARAAAGQPTVLTPHPLEAARLLAQDTAAVQGDRLDAAQRLAQRSGCTVVLKGSGSVIATPGGRLWINPTGNARLGSAGTGDVLAGWLGGLWSQHAATDGLDAAIATVWLHGHAAERGDLRGPLRAADLIEVMASRLP
jgi:ADP-dependent NAD(P)H-hydrate dehydratase / NAD(P)H-hydrate epimerase